MKGGGFTASPVPKNSRLHFGLLRPVSVSSVDTRLGALWQAEGPWKALWVCGVDGGPCLGPAMVFLVALHREVMEGAEPRIHTWPHLEVAWRDMAPPGWLPASWFPQPRSRPLPESEALCVLFTERMRSWGGWVSVLLSF